MITFEEADTDADTMLSEAELSALTIAQIKSIAAEKGYTITKRKKSDIIDEFLTQQG